MIKKLTLLIVFIGFWAHSQVFRTESQRLELQYRIANGWTDPDGDFINTITRMVVEKDAFVANPASTRFTNTDNNIPYRYGDELPNQQAEFDHAPTPDNVAGILYPFSASDWGWAMGDVSIANLLFTELLWHARETNLDFGNQSKWPRNRYADRFPYVLIAGYVHKWEWSWYDYIKQLQTIGTAGEVSEIETWFSDAAAWAYALNDTNMTLLMGPDWENENFSLSVGWGNSKATVLEDVNGNDHTEFATSDGADAISNNRIWSGRGLFHAHGLATGNETYRRAAVNTVKFSLKYSTFPNSIGMEINRTLPAPNQNLGLSYLMEVLNGMFWIAWQEETAWENGVITSNGLVREQLFDYSTTDGLLSGQTYFGRVFAGGSTTDGTTEKSILSFGLAINNFYKSAANGGWPTPYYSFGSAITGADKKFPSVFGAINTYYNNQEMYDHSIMSDAAGLPSGGMSDAGFGYGQLRGVFSSINGPYSFIQMEGKVFGGVGNVNLASKKRQIQHRMLLRIGQ